MPEFLILLLKFEKLKMLQFKIYFLRNKNGLLKMYVSYGVTEEKNIPKFACWLIFKDFLAIHLYGLLIMC